MSDRPQGRRETLDDIAGFLAGVEAFRTLDEEQLLEVAAGVTYRDLAAGETLIVEGGSPSRHLWVLREGALDLLRLDQLVTVMTAGELLGYASMLTQTAPSFTVRARSACALYCIPLDMSLALLSREDGVRWLASTQRDALLYAARSLSPLPEVQTLPVTSVIREAALVCDPEKTINGAAELMMEHGRSAILVRLRDGLGIVTDTDLRDKVVVGRASLDAPVSTIMSSPVHTVTSGTSAAEAAIAMLTFGVSHLPVVAEDGGVAGVVSARDLMTLDSRSPFALRRSVLRASDEDELAAAAGDIPALFCELLGARLDAATLSRVLTVLHDSITARLLELAFERHGVPPVEYAWLVFGSAARNEMTLASDQDNGLAHADTADPSVAACFFRVAQDVNAGLDRCGYEADQHGVLAKYDDWRMSASAWTDVFADCLKGDENERLVLGAIVFDYRQIAGRLYVEKALTEVIRDTPRHPRFKMGLGELGSEIRSPLGFRGRMRGSIDIKASGLLPIQNYARYNALCNGITIQSTPERLTALIEVDGDGAARHRDLREAYLSMKDVQFEHHAEAVRAGVRPDNVIDTDTLRPLTQAKLHEALRVVAAAQATLPRR